jgi:hypothetical protein
LQFLRERRDLGRAQFVEDDLEHGSFNNLHHYDA